ncbi:metallophosphoesterase [Enorma shizhengliae]|uniref:Calcineurin-like phosphoesterase domain-containing protein n=1 Tax=Enorma shizhengliae TaxID=2606615 RepID=A0A7K0GAZ0_9ACTN|nr:metallophosphoesterase [Enorma shizhengliae]MRX80574.1 hypothetical protein [Enorma shizhengliae]
MTSDLTIVQLSDLHFRENEPVDIVRNRAKELADRISSLNGGEPIVLLFSGDVAWSGKEEEYRIAGQFIDLLVDRIIELIQGQPTVLIVPGNHDVYQPPQRPDVELKEETLLEEIKRIPNFFNFVSKYEIWDKYNVVSKYKVPYVSNDVEHYATFTLCNSAPFSRLHDDKGMHYIPSDQLKLISKNDNDDPQFVVVHHSPEWFQDESRLGFELALQRSADILLYGHEHHGESYSLIDEKTDSSLQVIRGGTYSVYDDSVSTFKMIQYSQAESCNFELREFSFQWNASARKYVQLGSGCTRTGILKSPSLAPLNEFRMRITADENGEIGQFERCYTFPRIREDSPYSILNDAKQSQYSKTINCMEDFFSESTGARCIEIKGASGIGKTSLIKYLYLQSIRRGYSPILLTPDDSTHSVSRTVDNMVRWQYGDYPERLQEFTSLPVDNKIIYIDDFDQIKRKKSALDYVRDLLDQFGLIVVSTGDYSDWTDFGDVGVLAKSFRICPFTKLERDSLVRKRCECKGIDSRQTDRLISTIDRAAHWHVALFEMTPTFILSYLDYFIANPHEMLSQEEIPFEDILEDYVRRSIGRAASKNSIKNVEKNVNRALAVLDQLALNLHERRRDSINLKDLSTLINVFSEERELDLKPKDLICLLEDSRLITRCPDGYSVCFSSKRYHAFFVARGIDAKLDINLNESWPHVERLLDEILFSINEDIIALLTKIRATPELQKSLVNRACELVMNASPLSFSGPTGHVSLSGLQGLKIALPEADTRKAIEGSTAQFEEKTADKQSEFEYAALYDYDPNIVGGDVPRAFLALKYVEIAGSCLVKQETTLLSEDKEKIRSAIIDVTPRALNILISSIDERYDEIVDSISTDFGTLFSDHGAQINFKRLVSLYALAICLSYSEIIAVHATEDNTVDRLVKKCGSGPIDRMLKLNFLDYAGREDEFCIEACNWALAAKKENNLVEGIIVSAMASSYVLRHRNILQRNMDKLIRDVFSCLGGNEKKARAALFRELSTARRR